MNVVIISTNYPSVFLPGKGAFLYNFAQELSKYNKVTVISPFRVTEFFRKKVKTYGVEQCTVFRPLYLSFGSKKRFGINLPAISQFLMQWGVLSILKKKLKNTDIIYCHFLVSGLAVYEYAAANKIKLVIASGESAGYLESALRREGIRKMIPYISYIICVSENNYAALQSVGFSATQMKVIPNAVDFTIFKPYNKWDAKKALGINSDKFIIGFVGHFIERKGPDRIIDAINLLNDAGITLICVGSGGKLKKAPFVKVIAPVGNFELPRIMSAFDIFVLPTLSEGYCNVIEEAKACCIPVISSRGTSVEKQINAQNGILIDPKSIPEIAGAIRDLKNNDPKRAAMTAYLKEQRNTNSLEKRVRLINDILKTLVTNEL